MTEILLKGHKTLTHPSILLDPSLDLLFLKNALLSPPFGQSLSEEIKFPFFLTRSLRSPGVCEKKKKKDRAARPVLNYFGFNHENALKLRCLILALPLSIMITVIMDIVMFFKNDNMCSWSEADPLFFFLMNDSTHNTYFLWLKSLFLPYFSNFWALLLPHVFTGGQLKACIYVFPKHLIRHRILLGINVSAQNTMHSFHIQFGICI